MSLPFLFHLLITTIIYYIITTWFKFFLKLRLTVDFSYLAIVAFASYVTALLNIHYGRWMLVTISISRVSSIIFTVFILILSTRLSRVYFIVGTLALYMFALKLATNWEGVTNGTFWLSWISRTLMGSVQLTGLSSYLIAGAIIALIVWVGLFLFKKTYMFSILKWRGENSTVLQVLGARINIYTFIMILITSLCAVVGANLFTYYYLYIDPTSFWLSILNLVLVIWFISYKRWELGTFITAMVIIFAYEYLRFFKLVDTTMLGYTRESIFALIIMITSFITFRRTSFGREN